GYFNVEIHPELTYKTPSEIALSYNIVQNKQARVQSIVIEKANKFKSKSLVVQLGMRPDVSWWNLFSTSLYSKEGLSKDINKLQSIYLTKGFANFKVVNVVQHKEDNNTKVNLVVDIQEGKVYKYGAVRAFGNIQLYQQDINKIIHKAKLKGTFNINQVNALKTAITNYLYNKGLANAKVNLDPSYDNNTVGVNFIITTGHIIYVNNITFTGNTVTTDKALRDRIVQQPDALYSPALVAEGKGNLMRTGFFNTVTPKVTATKDKANTVNLNYEVSPRETGSFSVSIGYGSDSGVTYEASIVKKNFLGLGTTLSLTGVTEDGYKSLTLGYDDPYLTRSGIGLSSSVFYSDYNTSEEDDSNDADYTLITYGITENLTIPINNYWSYYVGATLEHNSISNLTPEYTEALYLKSIGATSWSSSHFDLLLNAGITYNDLNRGYFPQSGTYIGLGTTVSTPVFTDRYYTISLNVKHYIPLSKSKEYVLKIHGLFDYANGYDGKEVPFYDLYTAGGIDSLPGFESGTIGPRAIYGSSGQALTTDKSDYTDISDDIIGGNAMAIASLELIVPTPFVHKAYQNHVRTKLFVAGASVWDTNWTSADTAYYGIDENKPGDITASAGIAFEWRLPIGLIVFSYALPIKKYSYEVTEPFQFSIGGSF
ncbi:MAG: outer membrane protein assembly factor BamA, partial [Psittacicella sp.]